MPPPASVISRNVEELDVILRRIRTRKKRRRVGGEKATLTGDSVEAID